MKHLQTADYPVRLSADFGITLYHRGGGVYEIDNGTGYLLLTPEILEHWNGTLPPFRPVTIAPPIE